MKKILFISILALLSSLSLSAATDGDDDKIGVGVGLGISVPHGARIEAGVRFNNYLSTRVGLSFIPTIKFLNNQPTKIDLSGYKEQLGYTPQAVASAQVGSFAGYLLLDYHPFKNGFRVTVGAYIGRPTLTANLAIVNPHNGQSIMADPKQVLFDPQDMPKLTIETTDHTEKVVLQPSPEATIDAKVNVGRTFQPYLGVGYGYAVPNSRVSFMLDAGVLFNGKFNLTSPNAIEGDPNMLLTLNDLNLHKIRYYTQILPVLNLGISIRLF